MTEKANKEECLANARVVKVLAKKFGIGRWSFIGPGSDKKWYSTEENSPQGAWDHIAGRNAVGIRRKRTSYFPCKDSIVQGKSHKQRTRKTVDTFAADYSTIETIFCMFVSVNQLSVYGEVANICEEFEAHQDRSGQPDVLMGQSIVSQ